MSWLSSCRTAFLSSLKPALLPNAVVIYPLLFHYANNARIVAAERLFQLLWPGIVIAVIFQIVFLLAYRARAHRAALSAALFLVFCLTYGFAYDGMRDWDIVPVEHYTFLPFFMLAGIYTSFGMARLAPGHAQQLWNLITPILTGPLILNLVRIVPVEIQKLQTGPTPASASGGRVAAFQEAASHPDIFFIILQSDHGARNVDSGNPDSVLLENYPEACKTLIMNALYLPGCDTSALPQNIEPVYTFPIVFNRYFDANIHVEK